MRRYEALPDGVQPPIMLDEFVECEEAVRKSPVFREAMKKRGIEDISLVMVDAWSAGHYGNEPPEDGASGWSARSAGSAPSRTTTATPGPIENIVAVVDLNRKELVRVEDYGVVPLPPQAGQLGARVHQGDARRPQAAGGRRSPRGRASPSQGHEVSWQKWSFRVGFNPREGLVLHTVGYDGRPVLYRASIAEMMVPYADPKASSYHKNVFDLGEYGVGMLANSLALGCDCLGTIRYFDGHMADSRGRLVTIKNAICLHEEDFGMLWKHTDWRTGQSEVRRSRRLAVSMVATVGNYDYGFYWYFYQDGTIQMEVKLTGIVNTTALKPGEPRPLRHRGRAAAARPLSSALFQRPARLRRRRREQHGRGGQHAERAGRPREPVQQRLHRGGDAACSKESQAQRNTNPASSRFWRIVNPGRKNAMGRPVAYRLCPGETTLPFAQPGASLLKRAAFLTRNLWVTPFDPEGAVPGRRVSQPEPRRRRPAAVDEGRPRPRRPRPGRLVHLRPDPHPPARGLAGDAGGLRSGSCSGPTASSTATRRSICPRHGDDKCGGRGQPSWITRIVSRYFKYKSSQSLLAQAHELGLDVTLAGDLAPLFRPIVVGGRFVGNRLAIQPMEGCDGNLDGSPGQSRRRESDRSEPRLSITLEPLVQHLEHQGRTRSLRHGEAHAGLPLDFFVRHPLDVPQSHANLAEVSMSGVVELAGARRPRHGTTADSTAGAGRRPKRGGERPLGGAHNDAPSRKSARFPISGRHQELGLCAGIIVLNGHHNVVQRNVLRLALE